jgi:hypothetical protein
LRSRFGLRAMATSIEQSGRLNLCLQTRRF